MRVEWVDIDRYSSLGGYLIGKYYRFTGRKDRFTGTKEKNYFVFLLCGGGYISGGAGQAIVLEFKGYYGIIPREEIK